MDSFVKVLCTNCKNFYGSEERQGMCSLCYKNFLASEQNIKEPPKVKDNGSTREISNCSEDAVKTEPMNIEEIPTTSKPIQTNHLNCWKCNKKVGYLGFKCKCDYTFCGSHRHFSEHQCDFDYKSYDREKLSKKNNLELNKTTLK